MSDKPTKKINTTALIIGGMIAVTLVIVLLIISIGTKTNQNAVVEATNESTLEYEAQTQPENTEEEPEEDITEDTKDVLDETPADGEDKQDDLTFTTVPETTEESKIPEIPDNQTIIDLDTAFKMFVEDPYLTHVAFPGYGDFIAINHYDDFGMAVLINVNLDFVKGYAAEELTRNGYEKNILETTDNGAYQYFVDNGRGQTCELIYANDKMMILAGKSSSFERPQ